MPHAEARAASLAVLGRMGQPEDVAGPVAFLASGDARWMTGRVIDTPGGSDLLTLPPGTGGPWRRVRRVCEPCRVGASRGSVTYRPAFRGPGEGRWCQEALSGRRDRDGRGPLRRTARWGAGCEYVWSHGLPRRSGPDSAKLSQHQTPLW
ncbi:SDR family oxidoreductase [Streptomyces specialis]|uniref:SDR family oxidoreductase n=1 Tax=Streptomyces specialis TaxID=498367 RepID=UPI00099F308F